jgi:murein DD-endopeptidase MepM/ murein hydrolase activator NlpD
MLLKTENFNQVRQERETLRKSYTQMAQIAHDRSTQVASLGALANEVSALYGLRQNRIAGAGHEAAAAVAAAPAPVSLAMQTDDISQQQIDNSFDQLSALRTSALTGRVSRALESGLDSAFTGDWTELADAPSIWPVEGRIASGFGVREDPFNGEGAFHRGVDIDAPYGTPVRAAADGDVTGLSMGEGYGRQVVLDHGHDLLTIYGHLSAIAAIPGQHVTRGEVIGYVGQSGRATGPHLHYEVRVHNVPVNPHKYLRSTYEQISNLDGATVGIGQ